MSSQKQSKFFYALAIGFQLIFTLAIPIIVFAFLGVWIDGTFHLVPFGMVIGVLVGIVVSIYAFYALLKPILDDDGKGK